MLSSVLYCEVYGVCALVVLVLLLFSLKSESRSSSERWLIRLFEAFLCNFSCNILFTLVNSGIIPTPWPIPLSFAFKTLYFLTLALGLFCWSCYTETELSVETGKRVFLVKMLLMTPYLALVALVGMNLTTHKLFDIDALGGYHRGEHYQLFMLLSIALAFFFSGRHILRNRHEADPSVRSHMWLTVSCPVFLLAAWLLSTLGEAIPVICVCMMGELLCLYIGTSRLQISMDHLTQVNNRQNLISFMNYKLATHENRLFLLMVDVDAFKSINDTYGHLEGDKALIRVATALKRACTPYKKRPYISRYGGDEFIVVLEGARQEASDLCESIRENLRLLQSENADYPLTVSIGLAECRSGMRAGDLIELADEEMYKLKENRKKRSAQQNA